MTYDPRGNLSSVAGGIGVPAASYGYDALRRLSSAAVGGAGRSYRFDDFGNLQSGARLEVSEKVPSW